MTGIGEFRIGDDDRDRVIERINSAFVEGRLDLDELEERLVLVYQAKFATDLNRLLADLPSAPTATTHRVVPDVSAQASPAGNTVGTYGPFFIAPVISTIVYATTGFGGHFWPIWVWLGCMIPVVLGLVFGEEWLREAIAE